MRFRRIPRSRGASSRFWRFCSCGLCTVFLQRGSAFCHSALTPSAVRSPMLMLKLIGGAMTPVILWGALLFLPAGTFAWWQAWVFLVVVLACSGATMMWVFANNEALLNERYGSP